MNTLILVSIWLFVAALICRHFAGGHLTPPSHRMTTIEPTCLYSKQQRERQEFLRSIGSTCLWLCAASLLAAFVEAFK